MHGSTAVGTWRPRWGASPSWMSTTKYPFSYGVSRGPAHSTPLGGTRSSQLCATGARPFRALPRGLHCACKRGRSTAPWQSVAVHRAGTRCTFYIASEPLQAAAVQLHRHARRLVPLDLAQLLLR